MNLTSTKIQISTVEAAWSNTHSAKAPDCTNCKCSPRVTPCEHTQLRFLPHFTHVHANTFPRIITIKGKTIPVMLGGLRASGKLIVSVRPEVTHYPLTITGVDTHL